VETDDFTDKEVKAAKHPQVNGEIYKVHYGKLPSEWRVQDIQRRR
jgi:hypothetical protein